MTTAQASTTVPATRRRSFGRTALLSVLAVLSCSSAILCIGATCTASERRKVLVIYSYNELIPWQAGIHAGLQRRLEETDPEDRPDVYEERLDGTRIDFSIAVPAMTAYLRAKYSTFKFDAVIAESYGATRVLLQNPDLFAGARRYAIDPGVEVPRAAGDIRVVETQRDWASASLLAIPEVMPGVKRIVAVVDHSDVGQNGKRQLLAGAAALPAAIRFDVWDDFTFDELLDRAAALPPDAALFTMPVFKDRAGGVEIPRELVRRLAGRSAVPLFASHDTFMGSGIVGGRLLSAQRFGEMMGDLAFGGGRAEMWKHPEEMLNPFVFDEAALKRWHMRRDLLPSGTILVGSDAPMWERHPREIGGALAILLLQGCLILWLVRAVKQRDAAAREVILERDGLERRVADRTRDLLVAKDRLEASNVRLQDLADTDALTAAASRRKFLDTLDGEWTRTADGAPLSLLMLDIDRFKSINDGHGHVAGDMVIRAVADACRFQLGPADCLGRLGGEEFAILLPGQPVEAATACAERIRAAIRSTRITVGAAPPLCVTVSIGVSLGSGAAGNSRDLIARADAGLYRAKHGGRDRVIAVVEGEACPMTPVGAETRAA